ncbi:NHL repeat-containing protein [Gimesia aquarii]|uniref:Uncharacterized protein n=1 Tax=Gimesia aquarii TaxID=2527964 RepID=A0A517VRB8_9PLAN|nr:hypothetical protein [Gimesia aquarii]QDT95565.1 hypothetical protein V144x_10100 [Gimesia aquarii]
MTVRPKKQIYDPTPPTERATFITAKDDKGNYPLEGHGCNVMYCRYLSVNKHVKHPFLLDFRYIQTQTAKSDSRFALVYVGMWVPKGTIIEATKAWGRWWARIDCRTIQSIRKFDDDRNKHWDYSLPGILRHASDFNPGELPDDFDAGDLQGFVSVKVGSNGDVYALHNWSMGFEAITPRLVKFDPFGNELASVPVDQVREVRQLDLDADDNVYVGGTWIFTSPMGQSRFNLQKFDSDLKLIKVVTDADAPFPINHLVVKNGRVYCATESQGIINGYPYSLYENPFVWVYDLELELQSTMKPPSLTFSHARGVDVDDDGNIYVNGTLATELTSNGEQTGFHFGTVQKFTPGGQFAWSLFQGENSTNNFYPIHYRQGHFYFYGPKKLYKYTTDAEFVWEVPYKTWDEDNDDGQQAFFDSSAFAFHMTAIDSDADGNLFVTGFHQHYRNQLQFRKNTQKISPQGEVLWKFESRRTQHDIAVDRATDHFYTVGLVVEDDC